MSELDHPCKDTCSGWQQGFEKGQEALADKLAVLRAQVADYERVLELIVSQDKFREGDYGYQFVILARDVLAKYGKGER